MSEQSAGGLFRVKGVEQTIREANEGGDSHGQPGLVRRLGAVNLVLMGVGTIIGAGIFVITGSAAAEFAGPAIVFSFALAALGCALAGLCYAEFASLMPVAGSAYAYAYATLGEIVAWVIGWNLLMEYVFAGGYVAVGWSGYFVSLLKGAGVAAPEAFTTAPFGLVDGQFGLTGGVINLPAVLIALLVMMITRRGIGLSAFINAMIVVLKIGVLVLFLSFGLAYADPANWTPFLPANTGTFGEYGLSGVVRGAAVVFVAYLGFDAISTTAQETRNPQRNLPIGILGSLLICAILYGAVSLALTGLTSYQNLDVPNPLSVALRAAGGGLDWLVPFVDLAAVTGLASTLLVIMLAQPRILMAMSRDGLLPKAFARISPKFHTPSFGSVFTGVGIATVAGLFPIDILVQLVSLGTLSVFIAVCGGVLVLRRTHPELPRAFRVPFSPVVPLLGAAACIYLLTGLPKQSWILYGVWTVIGGVIYFAYGRPGATRVRQEVQAVAATSDSR